MPQSPTRLLSARKTRQTVCKTVEALGEHRAVIVQLVGKANAHSELLGRGFFGRLHWLLFGLPKPPAPAPGD